MKRFTVLVLVSLVVCLGCSKGDSLVGSKYSENDGGMLAFTLEFKPGNKVDLTNEMAGTTSEIEYKVEGDKIKLNSGGMNLVLTMQKDGTITGLFNGILKKQES